MALLACGFVALASCGTRATLPVEATYGPSPTLPEPNVERVPTVHIAPAKGWPEGRMPTAIDGLVVQRFASGLVHPRTLHVLPNGDVLVAETNKPVQPAKDGIVDRVMGAVQKRAGAGVPSANRITLLRDADRNGEAETRTAFLENLNSPFGMALVGENLYVANTDGVVRATYRAGEMRATDVKPVVDLPAGPRNHHWTKDLVASADGRLLIASVGSNSNVAEHGLAEEEGRAALWAIDPQAGTRRLFASGLRNPNGLAWEPVTGALWVAVNERDALGADLVPDYITSVREGGFYGWPWSYYGQHVDARVKPASPDRVAAAIVPDYAVGAHTASLGLAFNGPSGIERLGTGVFVSQHGSWNRKPRSGYKVIFVAFENGRPAGLPRDVLTGFLSDEGDAYGRPVGVALDGRGGLLVADDVGNVIWRVTAKERLAWMK